MPDFGAFFSRLAEAAAPLFVRAQALQAATATNANLFAKRARPTVSVPIPTGRRRLTTRQRIANYLASGPPRLRVDSRGRIVRPGQRSSSGSSGRGITATPGQLPSETPPQTAAAPLQERPLAHHVGPRVPPRPPPPAIAVPVQLLRGREVIFAHLQEYWPVRRTYQRLCDQMEHLQQGLEAGQDDGVDREAELEVLRPQEEEAFEHGNRLGLALANEQTRQKAREREYRATTGIELPPMSNQEPADIDEFTRELFAEIEQGPDSPPPPPLSPRAASNAQSDAETRAALPVLRAAHAALRDHRETYMAQRLAHEAGIATDLPAPIWKLIRIKFDQDHLRGGVRLTGEAKQLYDSWRARLVEAQDRGLGPFDDVQGDMFPHAAEGYTVSEEQGMIDQAPARGIEKWIRDQEGFQRQVDANKQFPLRRQDCMRGLEFVQPPEPGESASCCEVVPHVRENIERMREGSGYPLWRQRKVKETRDIGTCTAEDVEEMEKGDEAASELGYPSDASSLDGAGST